VLDAARIVPAKDVPSDIVTMNSRVVIADAGGANSRAVRLVYPEEADPARGDISVLSPLGNALLGARTGDSVTVRTPAGSRVVRVTAIEFQPEAAGRYDL
jgi:regulator of nucleoside diphosphate kinase